MSKDARNENLELTGVEQEKFHELVALLAKHGFGEAGPPRETTFAQIEQFGHQVGQMVARAIDARLAEQHAAHFAGEEPCPICGEKHLPKERPHDLRLQTDDGEVPLREPAFHCPPCERDFFPSTHSIADRRWFGQPSGVGEEDACRGACPVVLDRGTVAAQDRRH